MDEFEDLFAAIVYFLEEISLKMAGVYNHDTSAKATSFDELISFFLGYH